MKTNRIAMILLAGAALLLSACMREENFENGDISFETDEVVFRIGQVATRSEVESEPVINDLGSVTTDDGSSFVLRETVTSLDDASNAPETRGTPAFTENVKAVHKTFYTVAMNANTGAAVFTKNQDLVNGVEYTYEKDNDQGQGIWHYRYGEDIWGEGKLPTYFFMRMPGKDDGVTLGDSPYNKSTGAITFSYKTPDTATAQKDILFASYKREGQTNAEAITFYHALTGIKFANFFDYSLKEGAYAKAETIIKNIKITGIKNTGTCTITPQEGKKSYEVANWGSGPTGSADYTQAIDYAFAEYDEDLFPEGTLNADAAKQNLNRNDGSITFFFIPQTLSDDVTFEITFDVSLRALGSNGEFGEAEKTFSDVKLTVKLKDVLTEAHRTWKAGELHTYTLWPKAIGVKISDTMNAAKDTKSNVVVKNTGNTWQYVRVNLVGNWVGKVVKDAAGNTSNPTILMGYSNAEIKTGTDPTAVPPQYANETETEPWNDKDGYTNYGKFVNLTPKSKVVPATAENTINNWVRYDKYYYYTRAIGPNDAITEPLFDSYTVYTSPEFWVVDLMGIRRKSQDVHLEMDLMVEAIEAPTDATGNLTYPDGTLIGTATDGYIKAWVAALGLSADNDLLDLK